MNIFVLITLLLISSPAFSADTKTTALTADTSPTTDDLIATVNDPSGTPANRKATIAQVFKAGNLTITGTNVGLGSLVPGAALDVVGVVRATSFSGSFATGGWTSSSGKVVLTTITDNVGIGSATPGASLDMVGTSRSTGGYQVLGTGAGKIASPSGIQMDGANSTVIAPALAITTANNVGIGTTLAGSKLTVNGTMEATDVKITTNPSAGRLLVSNSVGLGTWMPSASLGISGSPGGLTTQLQYNLAGAFSGVSGSVVDTNGNIGMGTTGTGYKLNVSGQMASFNSSDGWLKITGNLGVGTSAPAGKLSIAGGVGIGSTSGGSFITTTPPLGGLLVYGNTGIGSLSPGNKLDVSGTIRSTGLQLNLAPLAGGNVLVSNSVGIGTWMPPATIGAGGGGSGTVTSSTVNQVARFSSTGTTVAGSTNLISDNTNVGVGTTVPVGLLDVNRKLVVLSGGNVGIGSITPGQALDVNGAIRSTASGVSLFTGGNVGIGTSAAAPQALYVVGNIYATTGLNIGIGTAAPTRLCIANNLVATCP